MKPAYVLAAIIAVFAEIHPDLLASEYEQLSLRNRIDAFLAYGPGPDDHLGPDFQEQLVADLSQTDIGDATQYLAAQIRPASEHISLGSDALGRDAQGRNLAAIYLYIRCCEPGRQYAGEMLKGVMHLYPIAFPRRFNKEDSEYRELRMTIVLLRQMIFAAFGESGDDRVLNEAFQILEQGDEISQRGVLNGYLTPLLARNDDALEKVKRQVADPSRALHDDPRLLRLIDEGKAARSKDRAGDRKQAKGGRA